MGQAPQDSGRAASAQARHGTAIQRDPAFQCNASRQRNLRRPAAACARRAAEFRGYGNPGG